jgi:hypothetical protein
MRLILINNKKYISLIYCFKSIIFILSAQTNTDTLHLYFQNEYFKPIYNANTDVSYFCPLGEFGAPNKYFFSTEINPNLFVFEPKSRPFSIAVTPNIKVRMFQNDLSNRSYAVRTPSFLFKVRFFYAFNSSDIQYRYLESNYVHHSNGQDGFVLNSDGLTINTYNGSFSTNYAYLSFNKGKKQANGSSLLTIGTEWHFPFVYHDPALLQNYGFWRVHVQGLYKKYKINNIASLFGDNVEHWRMQWKTSYAINTLKKNSFFDLKRRLNAEIMCTYLPNSEKSKAGFYLASGYYGEDPYNILFEQQYFFARIGAAVTLGK